MKNRIFAAILVASAGLCIMGLADEKASVGSATGAANRAAVVVELFTSEGCSSCPPADQTLAWLASRQPINNVQIIPMSEHVDYWNQQGWTDPFSSAAFSARQREYSDSLRSEAYTPQMVVDGKAQFVGSDTRKAVEEISAESRAGRAAVSLQPIAPAGGGRRVSFQVQVENLPAIGTAKKCLVYFAVTENNLASNVLGGENSGRTLSYIGVVRELKLIGKVEARAGATFSAQPEIQIGNGWKRPDLRAVVFVQTPDNHQIVGAAETTFPSSGGGA